MENKQPVSARKKFYTLVVIAVAMLGGGVLLIRTVSTLDEFKVYEGSLTEARIEHIREGTRDNAITKVFYFTLQGLDEKLAVRKNSQDYDALVNNLKSGDKVKIYYTPNGYTTNEGYNISVIQVEKADKVLLDISDANDQNKIGGYLFLGLGVLFGIGSVWRFREM